MRPETHKHKQKTFCSAVRSGSLPEAKKGTTQTHTTAWSLVHATAVGSRSPVTATLSAHACRELLDTLSLLRLMRSVEREAGCFLNRKKASLASLAALGNP